MPLKEVEILRVVVRTLQDMLPALIALLYRAQQGEDATARKLEIAEALHELNERAAELRALCRGR